jgi:tetratricopeptide (TPR) repeat protein
VRATCLLRLQRREQAIEALERAAALEPGSADFRMRLGKEYAGLARHAEAAEAYEAAIALAPGSWQPHLRFAEALLALGRSDDARVALEEAERLAPADEPEVAALAARLRDGSP